MNHNYLFVYGTLLRNAQSNRNALLKGHADFISVARFEGLLYLIDTYPGVLASQNKNDWVVGEVYQLRDENIILKKLDHYEECSPEFQQPTEYIRTQQKVVLDNGNTCTAWVYIYNWPVNEINRIVSGDFLDFTA